MKQRLDRSEALVQSHEAELSSLSEHQHQLVTRLNEDLAAMRAEKQQLQVLRSVSIFNTFYIKKSILQAWNLFDVLAKL